MKPTRKSLLTITTQAVKALLLIDPKLANADQLADKAAIRKAFDFDCIQAFSLDEMLLTHNACLDSWWATVLDLYRFDSMLRKEHPDDFI